MKATLVSYKVDLTKIVGEGDFPCPQCGVIISPEDFSERVYEIIETKVTNNELVELIIRCNKCESKIHLFGWS